MVRKGSNSHSINLNFSKLDPVVRLSSNLARRCLVVCLIDPNRQNRFWKFSRTSRPMFPFFDRAPRNAYCEAPRRAGGMKFGTKTVQALTQFVKKSALSGGSGGPRTGAPKIAKLRKFLNGGNCGGKNATILKFFKTCSELCGLGLR